LSNLHFQETEPKIYAGVVQSVEEDSLAAEMGLQAGDEVLAVNGHAVEDVIDVQFYAAEDEVEIQYRRAGTLHVSRFTRQSGQPLGLEFQHPTFDIDIRRCNNLCPFCFVLQTAPRMRRTLYIKDDDYRYSFLYGHFVTLTNLSERDWQRIDEQRLSPLYVSVHSTDLENRRACLANKNAPDVLEQLRWLAERGIEAHTQLVVTPGLNDGLFLEKSIHDLAELYPTVQSVSVVPVGLTKHHKYGHRAHTAEEAQTVLESVARWQAELFPKLGVRFAYPTDEWFLLTETPIPPKKYYDGLALEENGLGQVRGFLDEWRGAKKEIKEIVGNGSRETRNVKRASRFASHISRFVHNVSRSTLQGKKATLVTASLFAPTLTKTAKEFNRLADTQLQVKAVLNERLGHGITVAGLLMGQDIISQLSGTELGEWVVLPRVMFDHPDGISLDDVSPMQIAEALGRPVFLADAMGDVLDALTGRNALAFDPANPTRAPQPMKQGGWAVEKYL
jgi:putative radical SAM enzyme (TIGR03279 family)